MSVWVSPPPTSSPSAGPTIVRYAIGDSDARPWGSWRVVDVTPHHIAKRVEVNPGARLSAHRHKGRNEHWLIIEGSAEATFGDQTIQLYSGQAVYIPAGVAHRLTNPGSTPLILVEVQTGILLDEGDIVRLADDYGRADQGVNRPLPLGETSRDPVSDG